MKLTEPLDGNYQAINNLVLQSVSGDHANPVTGVLYYDSAAGKIAFYDGTSLARLGVEGGGGDADTLQGNNGAYYLDLTNATGALDQSDVTGLVAALAALIPAADKGAANGVATLGADSKVPSAQLPSLSIGERFTAADESAMLLLTAQIGDIAVRTDEGNAVYLLTDTDPSVVGSWTPIVQQGDVVSVNGQSGTVVLDPDDLDDAATAHKFASAGQLSKLDGLPSDVNGGHYATYGNGAATTITVTHNLGLSDANAFTWRGHLLTDDEVVLMTPTNRTVNAFNLVFPAGQAPGTNDLAVTVNQAA